MFGLVDCIRRDTGGSGGRDDDPVLHRITGGGKDESGAGHLGGVEGRRNDLDAIGCKEIPVVGFRIVRIGDDHRVRVPQQANLGEGFGPVSENGDRTPAHLEEDGKRGKAAGLAHGGFLGHRILMTDRRRCMKERKSLSAGRGAFLFQLWVGGEQKGSSSPNVIKASPAVIRHRGQSAD